MLDCAVRGRHRLRPCQAFGVRLLLGCLLLAVGLAGTACAPTPPQNHGQHDREQTDQGIGHAGSLPHLRLEVIRVLPHDRSSFTQGLEMADGVLFEGTGLRGESAVRAIDPTTGRVLRETRLPADLFGEGITITGDRIWQLTWQEGVAIERDRNSLAELRRVHYTGEGWGVCEDGSRLVTSDGSARLTFRDPATFAETGQVVVRAGDEEVDRLNELECVGGQVWANVWGGDEIVRIDPATGQ